MIHYFSFYFHVAFCCCSVFTWRIRKRVREDNWKNTGYYYRNLLSNQDCIIWKLANCHCSSLFFLVFSFLRLSIQKVSFVTIFLFASTLRNSKFFFFSLIFSFFLISDSPLVVRALMKREHSADLLSYNAIYTHTSLFSVYFTCHWFISQSASKQWTVCAR